MKEMKDYLPLYIGCRVVADSIYHLVGVTKSEVQPEKWIAICDPNPDDLADSFLEFYAEEIKLILRPLSSMTEDEARDLEIFNLWTGAVVTGRVTWNSVRFPTRSWPKALAYGFDMFNLKEAGLAVYE